MMFTLIELFLVPTPLWIIFTALIASSNYFLYFSHAQLENNWFRQKEKGMMHTLFWTIPSSPSFQKYFHGTDLHRIIKLLLVFSYAKLVT